MDTTYKVNIPTQKQDVTYEKIAKSNQVYSKKIITDDYDDDDDVDDKYDETMQDQENDAENKVEYRKRLIDIPIEVLPCPDRLIYEASFSPPTQDEVKYYKTSYGMKLTTCISNLALVLLSSVL